MEVTGILANCYRPSNRQTDRPTTKVSYKGQLLDLLCIASSWTYNILFIGSSWNGFCKKNPFRYYNVFFIVSLWLRILKNCFRYYNMFFIVSSWLRIFKNCFWYYNLFFIVSLWLRIFLNCFWYYNVILKIWDIIFTSPWDNEKGYIVMKTMKNCFGYYNVIFKIWDIIFTSP